MQNSGVYAREAYGAPIYIIRSAAMADGRWFVVRGTKKGLLLVGTVSHRAMTE